MRAGEREFEWLGRERFCPRAGVGQVERAAAERSHDDPGRTPAKPHAGRAAVLLELLEADRGPHSRHRPHEILDHTVGLGMIGVEAIELAVAHEIDPGALLHVEDDARGIDQRLLARVGDEPLGHRIGADESRQDARRAHAVCSFRVCVNAIKRSSIGSGNQAGRSPRSETMICAALYPGSPVMLPPG